MFHCFIIESIVEFSIGIDQRLEMNKKLSDMTSTHFKLDSIWFATSVNVTKKRVHPL
jgi:hypothetical protein